jgi:hypothetical protein
MASRSRNAAHSSRATRWIVIKAAIHSSLRLFGLDLVRFPPGEKENPSDFRKEDAPADEQLGPRFVLVRYF